LLDFLDFLDFLKPPFLGLRGGVSITPVFGLMIEYGSCIRFLTRFRRGGLVGLGWVRGGVVYPCAGCVVLILIVGYKFGNGILYSGIASEYRNLEKIGFNNCSDGTAP